MHRVKGPDNVVPDYISRLPVHLHSSPAFASRMDRIEELATTDACAVAYMSSILSCMQLRDRSTLRPPYRLLDPSLPKPTPYTAHDARDVSAGELYKHAHGDHPYDFDLPPQRPLPRSLPLTDEFSAAYATCNEFRPVWEALASEFVAYPFHRIGNFLYDEALLCVPSGFRESIIHHCNKSTGHKGFRPLLRAVRTEFFWGVVIFEVRERGGMEGRGTRVAGRKGRAARGGQGRAQSSHRTLITLAKSLWKPKKKGVGELEVSAVLQVQVHRGQTPGDTPPVPLASREVYANIFDFATLPESYGMDQVLVVWTGLLGI